MHLDKVYHMAKLLRLRGLLRFRSLVRNKPFFRETTHPMWVLIFSEILLEYEVLFSIHTYQARDRKDEVAEAAKNL